MKRRPYLLPLIVCAAIAFQPAPAIAKSGIMTTKHNLSKSGPGDIKSSSEDRICVFCHAPHNATPQTPLWNKNLNAVTYTPYSSSTMAAAPSIPTGPSRLCLSCHDGTIALGEVRKPETTIDMTVAGGMPSTRPSYIGTSLANHHPSSFSYYDALPNPELATDRPLDLMFYDNGVIECSTCHDPHDNTNKKFLAKNNEQSGLCVVCHIPNGWTGSPHNTALSTWNGTAPNPWPRTGAGTDFVWTSVQQNGCENCHAPHSAIGQYRLLNCYTALGPCSPATEEGVCFPCHNGNMIPPVKNIFAQFGSGKLSKHDVALTTGMHEPNESPLQINGHVECVDCHNAHMANNNKSATPPAVSGRLDGVSGVSLENIAVNPAANEYEICFKCHASTSAQTVFPPIPRIIQEYNTRLEFQTNNPSYHPVAGSGASTDVPSLVATLTTASKIYCTDCHSDESVVNGGTGSRGPHGSQFAPILREQYKTTNDNIAYITSNFALCYQCHYESQILSDNTFRKTVPSNKGGHSGHLGSPVYANCAACHDPHGIPDNGLSGSHARLINFDTRIASAAPGFSAPIFSGTGNRSGTCTLVCHDAGGNPVTHDGTLKYSYGSVGNINIQW